MGQSKGKDTLLRQWQLLRCIPAKAPGKTVSELLEALDKEGFDVTRRTIERDLQTLSEPFKLTCNDKGTPQGWHYSSGTRLSLPEITVSDALSLCLLSEYLKPLLPASILSVMESRFDEADHLLSQVADKNIAANWTDKVRVVPPALPLRPPVIAEGVLESVQEALLKDLQIECGYQQASADAPEPRRLHPLALVQRGPVMYLVATATSASQAKLYALHRFHKIEITDAPVVRPKGFNIDTYIAEGNLQFGNRKTLRLKASISEDLAFYLTETPLSEDMQIKERDEDYLLTATVADSWQLRWWVLSWGNGISIFGPTSLRREMARMIDRTRELYAATKHMEE
jgi:predicted DNA-binding transcriptional regulator YafY